MLSLTFYPQLCARKLFHIQCFEEPCSVKLLESQVDFTVNIRFVAFFYHTFFFFQLFKEQSNESILFRSHPVKLQGSVQILSLSWNLFVMNESQAS